MKWMELEIVHNIVTCCTFIGSDSFGKVGQKQKLNIKKNLF